MEKGSPVLVAPRARGERRTGEKKGKITKRRLVHIFSVKTTAAESGCGETGKGKGRTMVIFRLIFYVCPARTSGVSAVTYTGALNSILYVPLSLPFARSSVTLFICLLGFSLGPLITAGNHEVDGEGTRRRRRKRKKKERSTAVSPANFLFKNDINNLSQHRGFPRRMLVRRRRR